MCYHVFSCIFMNFHGYAYTYIHVHIHTYMYIHIPQGLAPGRALGPELLRARVPAQADTVHF